MPRLLIQHAGEDSRVFELSGDRPISVGRARSSTLMLDDPSVSRLHAVLRASPDGSWQIVDRDSANGLKVRGARVKEAVLRPGDEIGIGEFRLRFEDSAERQVVTYGTTKLPPSFASALKSAYTGSFMAVESLADSAPHGESWQSAENAEARLKRVLSRVSRALAGLQAIEQVIQRSLDFVFEIEGAERAFAMLVNEASLASGDPAGPQNFEPASVRYREGSRPAAGAKVPQFTISRSIIKQVTQDGLPLLVSDAKSDPRLSASQSIALAGIQSAMCAPLGIGKKLRGLLYVDNLSRRGMFEVHDLNVFAIIAVQTGIAISRVRARQEAPETIRP